MYDIPYHYKIDSYIIFSSNFYICYINKKGKRSDIPYHYKCGLYIIFSSNESKNINLKKKYKKENLCKDIYDPSSIFDFSHT